jgi:glycosyltransferase involved in cell wall biosynthesis
MKDYTKGYWVLLTYHLWRSGPCTRIKDVAVASTLLAAATLLRLCGYPDRRLFHRLQKGDQLWMETSRGTGSGMLYYRADTLWNAADLEGLAVSSEAQWILWSESAREPMEDVLPLFEDERTFAVCLQSHFRGWNPLLITTAPFRKLQAGEASSVIAPISPLMLVDRRKLLALGIPQCSMARTAWMLLFWKAAAAGWRSYCIGGGGAAGLEPDYPLQERAFIFHVLADAQLRRLAPREPDLIRGNIAFQSARIMVQTEPSGKLKVLIISPFLPYPLAHGGAVRIFNLCRALRQRVDFSLVALRESCERIHYAKLHEIFDQVRVIDNDEPASEDAHLPAQVRAHQCRGLRAAIAQLAAEWQPDFLQIEYTHLAAFRDSAPHVPAILVEHDLTFSLYRRLAEGQPDPEAQREYERWLDFERDWLQRYDGVWTVSEDDRQTAIGEGSRPHQTFAVPNGVDIDHFKPANSPATFQILYVGSFRHLPNILGFEHLMREIMPRIWSSFPQAQLHVVAGPQHTMYWRNLSRAGMPLRLDNRILVEGFVEDLRPLYTQASIVVVPLEVSAGTNIKVLEAMACGKAIITTPAGCAGLQLRSGHDAFVCANWEEFARCACELLMNPTLRARLAAQARRTAEQRFGWQASADCAYRSYAALAALQDRSEKHVRI